MLTVSDPYCKWLALKREGRLLLYLVTWNGQATTLTLTPALKRLGLAAGETGVSRVVDAETGEELTRLGEDHSFTIDLEGFGVRTLRLE